MEYANCIKMGVSVSEMASFFGEIKLTTIRRLTSWWWKMECCQGLNAITPISCFRKWSLMRAHLSIQWILWYYYMQEVQKSWNKIESNWFQDPRNRGGQEDAWWSIGSWKEALQSAKLCKSGSQISCRYECRTVWMQEGPWWFALQTAVPTLV